MKKLSLKHLGIRPFIFVFSPERELGTPYWTQFSLTVILGAEKIITRSFIFQSKIAIADRNQIYNTRKVCF